MKIPPSQIAARRFAGERADVGAAGSAGEAARETTSRETTSRETPSRQTTSRQRGPRSGDELTEVDRALLTELEADGRITNAALAARVGIAESTCLARVRALRDSGVITGIHAHVDPAAVGYPIQAMIRVRLSSHIPDHVHRFHAALRTIPGLIRAFHTAGADDYLLHVAVETPAALRRLILEHITVQPGVSHTETQLLFEQFSGPGVL